jgi:Tfp pilus assembly protein PilO
VTRRYVVAGAVAIAVVLLFFLVLLKPKFSEISDVRSQIESEKAKTQSLQIRLRQLQGSQRNQVQTLASLAALNRALPPTPDLPTLIRQLQKAASDSGMDLASIAPSPPSDLANATGVGVVTVNLQVSGGFFRLESFMTRLEDLQRVLEVSSMSVAPVTDQATGLTSLSSTITFRMYVVQADARLTGAAARPVPSAPPSPAPTTTTPSPTPTATR